MANIMISVLVLTYNHEKYISEALDSILCQKTSFTYEILVGDDASTDSTRKILQAYSKRYPNIFHLFFHAVSIGTTKNSFYLMENARGKYLASCEGDDFWIDPDKLERQVQFLETNPQYIGCAHKVRLVDEAGNALKCQYIEWISEKKIYSMKDFKGIFLPGHGSTLVRRNIFLEPMHDYSIMWTANRWIGDRTSNLLFISKGNFYKLNRTMSCYRYNSTKNGASVTSKVYCSSEARKRDYEYSCCLESYAKNVLGVEAGFDFHKAELLLSEIFQLRKGKKAVDWVLVKKLFSDIKKNYQWPLFIMSALLHKMEIKSVKRWPGLFPLQNRER